MRPLTTTELCHAFAVEEVETKLDPDNIPDIEDLVSVCAGLLIVDKESDIVRLVHYTAQNYFEGIREDWNPTAQYDIASTCLTYLLFDDFKSGACNSAQEFRDRNRRNVFFPYAALYWSHHARPVEQEVSELSIHMLRDDLLVDSIVQVEEANNIVVYPHRDWGFCKPRGLRGLHLVASSGLQHLLEVFLRTPAGTTQVNWKNLAGNTPLAGAAERGHEAIVRLLVERDDVDADSKDTSNRTPLSKAAAAGHEAIVRLLVERDDVDADCKDHEGKSPLWWAAEYGYEGVVRLLLERNDVEADSKDRFGQTPLFRAARGMHESVMSLLMEHNVDADLKDSKGGLPSRMQRSMALRRLSSC